MRSLDPLLPCTRELDGFQDETRPPRNIRRQGFDGGVQAASLGIVSGRELLPGGSEAPAADIVILSL